VLAVTDVITSRFSLLFVVAFASLCRYYVYFELIRFVILVTIEITLEVLEGTEKASSGCITFHFPFPKCLLLLITY
jgi:hypothetical protein